jgi:hypothetical protein
VGWTSRSQRRFVTTPYPAVFLRELSNRQVSWLYHVCRWRGINRGTWVDELFTSSSSAVNVISPIKVSAKTKLATATYPQRVNRGGSYCHSLVHRNSTYTHVCEYPQPPQRSNHAPKREQPKPQTPPLRVVTKPHIDKEHYIHPYPHAARHTPVDVNAHGD